MRYKEIILELINTSHEHMTAEQIFFLLKEKYPAVVLATIYNNLNSLYLQKKIKKISIEGCPDRYDRNTRHDHVVCPLCGQLSDVRLSDITPTIEEQLGNTIEGYDLKIQAVCTRCRANASNKDC